MSSLVVLNSCPFSQYTTKWPRNDYQELNEIVDSAVHSAAFDTNFVIRQKIVKHVQFFAGVSGELCVGGSTVAVGRAIAFF